MGGPAAGGGVEGFRFIPDAPGTVSLGTPMVGGAGVNWASALRRGGGS
jgi:hypothetical protein